MKVANKTNYILCFLISVVLFTSCSKDRDDNTGPMNTKIEVSATKINTAVHNPNVSMATMGYNDNTFYVLDIEFGKSFPAGTSPFMAYDVVQNTWTKLYVPSFVTENTDYGVGKLVYRVVNNTIYSMYYGNEMLVYATSKYPVAGMQNQWFKDPIPTACITQYGTYTYGGGAIYTLGNIGGKVAINRLGTDWKQLTKLNEKWTATPYRNSLFYNKKIYALAVDDTPSSDQILGYIYDTEALMVEKIAVPSYLHTQQIHNANHQLAVYKDVMLVLHPTWKKTGAGIDDNKYSITTFNTKTKVWGDAPIDLPDDFLNEGANLFVTETGKIYAAGIKNNNFALYELQLRLPDGW